MNTTTMKWLLRREFWEHKGSMFWAPAIVGALLVLLVGATTAYGLAGHPMPNHITINGQTVANGGMSGSVTIETRAMVARIASSMYMGASAPLFAILAAVVFFYCLGALYDERRDRSILFWKSLPVSDGMTVLSKAATAMLLAPLITLAIATLVSLALLLIVCVSVGVHGTNLFGPVLSSPDLYLSPLRVLALLPVYVVWALPTVGWLLLVSSWARTKPFLWAVGIPVVTLIMVKWIEGAMASASGTQLGLMPYVQDVVARILAGLLPGIWFAFQGGMPPGLHPGENGFDAGALVNASYGTLAGIDAWVGVALGLAMLYGAVRMRRWRDEG